MKKYTFTERSRHRLKAITSISGMPYYTDLCFLNLCHTIERLWVTPKVKNKTKH